MGIGQVTKAVFLDRDGVINRFFLRDGVPRPPAGLDELEIYPDAAEALRRLKEYGVTSVQIYTFWKGFEPGGRGQFDWSFYDREVALLQDAGLKYVPFILMGPKYAAPQWWLASPEHVGLRCLEHDKGAKRHDER